MKGYDPAIHHRQSIRLKGHDYAGGGIYFVTICAHQEFIQWAAGHPFTGGTTPAQEIIAEEWRRSGELRPGVIPGEFIVMPDHFHGLIEIRPGASQLGHLIGAFKAAVSRRIRRSTGDKHVAPPHAAHAAPPKDIRIWHRNYHEKIVRTEAEHKAISTYIRLNPVRLVFQLNGMTAFGNPALWEKPKLGILASGNDPLLAPPPVPDDWALLSGFHSGQEQQAAKQTNAPCIMIPATAPKSVGLNSTQLTALGSGRLLVACPFDVPHTTRENALARNRLVADWCDKLWIPAARPGGSLEKTKHDYAHKLL